MEINDLKELAFAFADKAAQKNLAKLAVKTDEFSITVETHAPVAAAAGPHFVHGGQHSGRLPGGQSDGGSGQTV